ncbi:putative thymidylate synthase [Colletotrichum spinosum]|uniref:Putative thymidylate synthase n=1 Tax=Colletotrichum spinosum TaxID=1347390 RepID=A0A4R8PXN2_9PEZI|nr:putative thymidylate synthase [Colletotrichum spinosum]
MSKAVDPAADVAAARSDGQTHLLIASSGSVAVIKLRSIVESLSHHKNLSIRIILTAAATEFLNGSSEEQPSLATIRGLPNVDGVHLDADEWTVPWRRGNAILHIELRRWADALLIAPLSANTLAKIANGLSDNLLLSVVRAWDPEGLIDGRKKKILVATAMNTAMHLHPVTGRHLKVLEEDWKWFHVIKTIEKALACGDVGSGAMASVTTIQKAVEDTLGLLAVDER